MPQRPPKGLRYRVAQVMGWAMLLGVIAAVVVVTLPSGDSCTADSVTNMGKTVFAEPPCVTLDDGPLYEAVLETTEGQVIVLLEPRIAPTTVNHFVFLSRNGFYDGSPFHRIETTDDHAVAQAGGRPETDGRGTAGYFYEGEPPSPQTTYQRGVIAMVDYRAADEINGDGSPPKNASQFFIIIQDWDDIGTPNEFPRFTVFGRVFDAPSLAILDRIALLGTPDGTPYRASSIERVTIRVIDRYEPTPSSSPLP